MAAVRVPPSACNTSQSRMTVRSPSACMSTTARRRAADEALDFMGAAGDFAALGLARGAGERGAGEHAVLGGDPAAAAVAQPGGDALLDGGVAEDAGVADRDKDGAFGGSDVVGREGDGTKLIGGAAGANAGNFVRRNGRHREPCC